MVYPQLKNEGKMRWRLLVGLLCVALLILAGTLSVAHGHEDGINHADCGLCATAHVSVQMAVSPDLLFVAQVRERFEPRTLEVPPKPLYRFSLFTRPPPADAHLNS